MALSHLQSQQTLQVRRWYSFSPSLAAFCHVQGLELRQVLWKKFSLRARGIATRPRIDL